MFGFFQEERTILEIQKIVGPRKPSPSTFFRLENQLFVAALHYLL
jgi:hypothetical protein